MAERVGFEPTIPVKVCPLSRRIVSTTHAPLRVANLSRDPWLRSAACQVVSSGLAPAASSYSMLRPGTSSGFSLHYSTFPEERLNDFRASSGEHSAAHFHQMIQLRVVEQV